jgi:hypothetical protein
VRAKNGLGASVLEGKLLACRTERVEHDRRVLANTQDPIYQLADGRTLNPSSTSSSRRSLDQISSVTVLPATGPDTSPVKGMPLKSLFSRPAQSNGHDETIITNDTSLPASPPSSTRPLPSTSTSQLPRVFRSKSMHYSFPPPPVPPPPKRQRPWSVQVFVSSGEN